MAILAAAVALASGTANAQPTHKSIDSMPLHLRVAYMGLLNSRLNRSAPVTAWKGIDNSPMAQRWLRDNGIDHATIMKAAQRR